MKEFSLSYETKMFYFLVDCTEFFFTHFLHRFSLSFSICAPQKFRLIVRIDEDVQQLREKMQAEAQAQAELYSL